MSRSQSRTRSRSRFGFGGFMIRLCIALVLVLATFNPSTWSYYHWAMADPGWLIDLNNFDVLKAFVGLIIFIGWVIFLSATMRSLGIFGLILAAAFIGTGLWLLVDSGWIATQNEIVVTWLVLIGISAVLAIGISWSHLWRRLTGQIDVDDADN